ncbi:hypothetical protein PMZ80_006394 [Knufia obscura]|uniref:Zn(2)-C6 fungal-type domain-containing protein n=2 Tax=Knufia TaxID=430999 RepID=A0AAN8EE29_9EURO|nr:hypothetical protein PMZ80_006394 [Knufia obscura]KAK5953459.1 hypothetical protein OHC33_005403 [Knufia fluminis]
MSNSASPQSYSAGGSADHAQGPARKKMRKGTKSCIECRRRKIKCTFELGRSSICNECFARGSTCIDQEHADTASFAVPPSTSQQKDEQNAVLKDRVTYLEDLVKQVLERLPEKNGTASAPSPKRTEDHISLHADAQAAEVLKSLRSPVRSQTSIEDTIVLPGSTHSTSAPALSLFDNAVITRKEVPVTISRAQYNKSKSLIAALLHLLPTPDDLELILENSQEWWAIWRTMFPNITDKRCITIKESVSHSLRSEKPAEIAKIMLCIALSINQLPHDFNWDRVSLEENPADLMERYISTVDRLIISDDEIAATIDGLECMILEAKYHINLGRPRKAWLLYHRAIAFGQLLGLHRLSLRRPKQPDTDYYRQLMVWTHLVMGDRYLSLVLGLPYSVAETFVQAAMAEAAAVAQDSAAGEAYLARMGPIMTKLIDRNQSPDTVPYSVTLNLDREMDELFSTTPKSWWTPERLPNTTIEEHFDRLQAQFFHYHAKVLLHMPFMLRSSADKLYQYSHTVTLDAARNMIEYFDALRGAENVGPHICKLLDFQAFTAAMLLLLNLCGYNSHTRGTVAQQPDLEQDQEDSAHIDRTITLLRIAANEPGGVVASQCAKALDMLGKIRTGVCNGDTSKKEAHKETCQIAIPYFGTISIGAGKHFVPIKPGTYPEAGTVRRSISTSTKTNQHSQSGGGLPTPNSSTHSCQPSPSMSSDGVRHSPYEYAASGPSVMDNSWTANTEDPFITFDSFMAFPGAQVLDYSSASHINSGATMSGSGYGQQMPDINQQQAINIYGPQFQEQSMPAEGFPFPAVSGGMELDNGWNWFAIDTQ